MNQNILEYLKYNYNKSENKDETLKNLNILSVYNPTEYAQFINTIRPTDFKVSINPIVP